MTQKYRVRVVITVQRDILPNLYEVLSPLAPKTRSERLKALAEGAATSSLGKTNTAHHAAAGPKVASVAVPVGPSDPTVDIGRLLAGFAN